MFFKKGDLIGSVSISFNQNAEFTVQSTFRDNDMEMLFFIFMIDKVLADCTNQAHAQNIMANVIGYVSGIESLTREINQAFGHYSKVPYLSTPKSFENNFELRAKSNSGNSHLFIWSNFSPKMVPNIDGKFAVTTLLYTIDLYSRLSDEEKEFFENILSALLHEYTNGTPPSMKNLTKAPTMVVNVVNRMGEIMSKNNLL